MFEEVPRDESAYVGGGPGTFPQPVVAIGVHHVVERLPELDQTIYQMFDVLEMGIRLSRAVHDE